jgi:hypothetical protein
METRNFVVRYFIEARMQFRYLGRRFLQRFPAFLVGLRTRGIPMLLLYLVSHFYQRAIVAYSAYCVILSPRFCCFGSEIKAAAEQRRTVSSKKVYICYFKKK